VEAASATLQGNFVVVTLEDGRTQAYLVQDVDLHASGLVDPAPKAPPEVAGPLPLPRVQRRSDTLAQVVITDADVKHVSTDGDEPADRASEEGPSTRTPPNGGVVLQVSGLRHQISGGLLTLTGIVRNDGPEPVTALTVRARAVDPSGDASGAGTTRIPGDLAPGKSVGFGMDFPVRGAVTDLEVEAGAVQAGSRFPSGRPAGGASASPR